MGLLADRVVAGYAEEFTATLAIDLPTCLTLQGQAQFSSNLWSVTPTSAQDSFLCSFSREHSDKVQQTTYAPPKAATLAEFASASFREYGFLSPTGC
jgi:hypothetical protein